jgi:subtilisin family serine protease
MPIKLGPNLKAHMFEHHARNSSPDSIQSSFRTGERLRVLVDFRGAVEDLTAVGFVLRSFVDNPERDYKIATGTIPLDRVEELASIDHVNEVELPTQHYPLLNDSLPEIHAITVHQAGHKGKGVVIGIIDSGIDWRHGAFTEFDGRISRILALWDQITQATGTETKGPGNLGVVYTRDQISRALQGLELVRSFDKGTEPGDKDPHSTGHGTHVAGIAAGDGTPASCCRAGSTYVGIAPLSDIIVVRSDLATDNILAALDFIFNHRDVVGKGVVVNMSFGSGIGPHDGTSYLDRMIDSRLAANPPGKIVVAAAGNAANGLRHAKGTVPNNGFSDVEFTVAEGIKINGVLDLWYQATGTLNLTVTAPGATGPVVNHGTTAQFIANPTASASYQSTVKISSDVTGQHGRDNEFVVNIDKPKDGPLPSGKWNLRLTNPGTAPVSFHCWSNASQFLSSDASSDNTIESPGSAASVITVGAYEPSTSCCNCQPSNQLADFSSRGPLMKNAAANPKPDIAAPGSGIYSTASDVANFTGACCNCCPDSCCCLYREGSGTSMAAPHVTGAVALLLEQDRTLTRSQVVEKLKAAALARPDKPVNSYDPGWGWGKLDVAGALGASGRRGGGGSGDGPLMQSPAVIDDTISHEHEAFESNLVIGSYRTIPHPGHTTILEPAFRHVPSLLQILRSKLRGIPESEHIAAAISRHFSEVRRLINTNRRVATMWHRAEGPRLLRRLLHGSLDANVLASSDIDTAARYLGRCFDLLTHYGSPRLRDSMAQYRLLLIALLAMPICIPINSTVSEGA